MRQHIFEYPTPRPQLGKLSTHSPVESGRRLGGRYLVCGRLGNGNHAWVVDAIDEVTDRQVAVKIFSPTTPGDWDAALREAQLMSRVTSQHVPRVYDMHRSEGDIAYFVMERLYGQTLAARLRAGRLRHEAAWRIAYQLASGLAATHAANVVHGDLHAGNVFVSNHGSVHLLDFSCARSATREGGECWTSDVRDLCGVIVASLTGRPPPRPHTDPECFIDMKTLWTAAEGRVDFHAPRFLLSARGVAVSKEIEQLIERALSAGSPVVTASQLRDAIGEFIAR